MHHMVSVGEEPKRDEETRMFLNLVNVTVFHLMILYRNDKKVSKSLQGRRRKQA